ncbi:sigma-70 family RNA polymerase sigma factor [Adhaeribacter swui]|uniref:Sigma-70 family RNA polymerase sigma factor n=1 Tax=Adhaeribacter swui TaxID=2086471 RepID=A0A7G7G7U9_9BACT|nr:sigma-70 family RNA polymerase sigma factor [Adhaeribacter swui]QNF33233.1 sigma-70 family RNA polymerase sigma factor [Adhaeribacter swui]
MASDTLLPHLFRTEFSKLVAVLTKTFGLAHVETAEDIASDTFLQAADTWPYNGIPANPTAWLYAVAKNKAKNYFTRDKILKNKFTAEISATTSATPDLLLDLSEQNIQDSQLRMLFAICHPVLSPEAQICLALRILGGFGLNEIATAFLTNKETIHKRLQRAKEKLRSANVVLEMPATSQIPERLQTVLHTIYLLFSEGYYSENRPTVIQKELCLEAVQLAYLLLQNPLTNTHATNALMALMCLQASRLEARQAANGQLILYANQDRQRWNSELMEKGFYYLMQASKWPARSTYYLEASIAYWHTVNNHPEKWPGILKLYDALLAVAPSPVVALNRVYAFAQVHGHPAAIKETEKLKLETTHFYWILLAELYQTINPEQSKMYLQRAIALCQTTTEKEQLTQQLQNLNKTRVQEKPE